MSQRISTPFTDSVGIDVPLICGAMYPCTNPELVAAVSDAGGIGIIQPLSMEFVHGVPLRDGIRVIKQLTSKPFGINAIVEKTVKAYTDRMMRWVDIALEEGVGLIITALGKPDWVIERARPAGVPVYHDVINRTHAQRALDFGVDGLVCVNRRAGGHAGKAGPQELFDELSDLGVPLVCAGGVGDASRFVEELERGYAAVQMGTRFIATPECHVHAEYKDAIVGAREDDIVLTDKISGVPCAVIKTPYLEKTGINAGWLGRWLLRGRRTKHLARALYQLRSIWALKRSVRKGLTYKDVWQAGKSVETIHAVEPAGDIVRRFAEAAAASPRFAGAAA
jgi:nitronate monooxygenase